MSLVLDPDLRQDDGLLLKMTVLFVKMMVTHDLTLSRQECVYSPTDVLKSNNKLNNPHQMNTILFYHPQLSLDDVYAAQ